VPVIDARLLVLVRLHVKRIPLRLNTLASLPNLLIWLHPAHHGIQRNQAH